MGEEHGRVVVGQQTEGDRRGRDSREHLWQGKQDRPQQQSIPSRYRRNISF